MRGRKPTNLIGKRFGKLVVTGFIGVVSRRAVWGVRCDCGGEKQVLAGNLKQGHTKSCGCMPGGPEIVNLEGTRFGRLVALRFAGIKNTHAAWACACDCGRIKTISAKHLNAGTTLSCGCLAREETVKRNRTRTGNKSHFWKGGATSKSQLIRVSEKYKDWRKAVFARDNYLCQECGVPGEIQAHHIEPFARFPELRLEVSNGQTLCVPCHKKTPSWGGKK